MVEISDECVVRETATNVMDAVNYAESIWHKEIFE